MSEHRGGSTTGALRSAEALALCLVMSTLSLSFGFSPVGHASSGTVQSEVFWGTSETFWNVTTGTHDPAVFHDMNLSFTTETDSVVLDGWLYEMTRYEGVSTVARYAPSGPLGRGDDWNISVEVTRPKEAGAYESCNMANTAGSQSLIVYLTDATDTVFSAVTLTTGTLINESIKVYDARTHRWTTVSKDLLPSNPHDFDSYGLRPDRYIVSFAHAKDSDDVAVAVFSTAVGSVYARNHSWADLTTLNSPVLRFDCELHTGRLVSFRVPSGWILDNLMFRSMWSRYPVVEPTYEYVVKGEQVWLKVVDQHGADIADAEVSIEGHVAAFNDLNGRYEAYVPRVVDWDVPMKSSVVVDGIVIDDTIKVTTLIDPIDGVSLPRWWSGWDWVSVFGQDDSTSAVAASLIYSNYSHPMVSYLFNSFAGNSTSLLETQSEIAIHLPHDFYGGGTRFWDEAVLSAESGHATLEKYYWFASRWDDPRYVGKGDTYLSFACPGNAASWEHLYAQYLRGTRMMGITSQYYLPGNSSLIGSYWVYGHTGEWLPEWGSWHPHSRLDLMDTYRAVGMDTVNPNQWRIANTIASNGGVLRVYAHWVISSPEFLHWISNIKSNSSYENWKATDGEIASYLYGRYSTDVSRSSETDLGRLVLNVSRRDPHAAGYWNVPVTVAVDMKDRRLIDIEVVEGGRVQSMSDGTLKALNGKRVMDVGYDLRGDTLHVSHFWNSSAQLRVSSKLLLSPYIVGAPPTTALVWGDYSANLTATAPDYGTATWTVETDADWLSVDVLNETSCWLHGTPTLPGTYSVRVRVSDSNNTDHLNWTITALKNKILSGHVRDSSGDPLPGLLLVLAVKDGKNIRLVENITTDSEGNYSITLTEAFWAEGDKLVLSASKNGSHESVSATATKYPYQELNLRFEEELNGLLIVGVLLALSCAFAVVASVAVYRKYR